MSQLRLNTDGGLGDTAGFGVRVARELEDTDEVGFVASEDLLGFGGRLDVVVARAEAKRRLREEEDVHGTILLVSCDARAEETALTIDLVLLSDVLEEVFLGLDSLKGLELGDKGLVALAIALSAIQRLLVEDGDTIVVRALSLRLSDQLLYDVADLRSGRVAENVEGAEAAVGRLEGILAYPASVAVAVEVVLRAYLSVHVGEADAWDLLGLGLLSAEAGGKNPLC